MADEMKDPIDDLTERLCQSAGWSMDEMYWQEDESGIRILRSRPKTLSDGSPRQDDGLDDNREMLIALEKNRRAD